MRLSANVSAGHLLHPTFVDRLQEAVNRYPEVGEGDLELEILETAAISDLSTLLAHSKPAVISVSGLRWMILGLVYSSLTYLRNFPSRH